MNVPLKRELADDTRNAWISDVDHLESAMTRSHVGAIATHDDIERGSGRRQRSDDTRISVVGDVEDRESHEIRNQGLISAYGDGGSETGNIPPSEPKRSRRIGDIIDLKAGVPIGHEGDRPRDYHIHRLTGCIEAADELHIGNR